jgi:3-hydroxyacyl-CoA dehydrogenase
VVSSNTSGLSIVGMTEGRSDDFRQHFLVTHFFNPVRYMKLLELVAGEETLPATIAFHGASAKSTLGKGIVYGKDTTNFIANRIGVYGMMKTIQAAIAGATPSRRWTRSSGPPWAAQERRLPHRRPRRPRHFVHVAKNCYDSPGRRGARHLPAARLRAEDGRQGLARRQVQAGLLQEVQGPRAKKEILSLDLKTLEYREQGKVRFDSLKAARIERRRRASRSTSTPTTAPGSSPRGDARDAGLRRAPPG